MTVGLVTEMWSRYSSDVSSQDGAVYQFNGTRGYQIDHSADATESEILADSALPQLWVDTWPNRGQVFCYKASYTRIGPNFSQVIYDFSGQTSEAGTIFSQLPKWTWSNSVTTEPVDVDAFGVPFVNSVGDVKEGFTKEVSDFTLTVERPFASINTFAINAYLDSVNSDPFGSPDAIWPAGTGALQQFIAPTVQNGPSLYYNVTARIDFRVPYLTIPARAWWYRYRNDGLNVVEGTPTTVSFSGGNPVFAAKAYPVIVGGVVTQIVVYEAGSGYQSAPTVTITGSGGSGASATANLVGENLHRRVGSVTVNAGGSGYPARRVVRAVDANKEPEQRPVLLKANGNREYNANSAIFIERPKKQYALPYSGLGLF